jgi:carbamoyl-phosphate synthase large subunit
MTKYERVLILGSGGLCIGQAGEFDYSGTQAIKALKEEGIQSILVNPNIATVQTDHGLADKVYLLPLDVDTVTKIIEKERPDGIFLSFGGQTALNLGIALNDQGVLKRYGVKVLGTPISTVRTTEDRQLFKEALDAIDVKTCPSIIAHTVEEAVAAAETLGYPIMMRSGYSLGGLGSGKIVDSHQLRQRVQVALARVPHILIEEYLEGWKEIEYEIVRDCAGNTIAVCNMENLDPMGIHTGESIVVAPSQTLSNNEYHALRSIALKTIDHLGIIGECNIQYALHPKTGDYRVIEVNARLSRSSALASKATGYPLAFVAAKLALGRRLHELRNHVTRQTSAFFEPALDYIVVKMPRWDTQKFKSSDRRIGSEMKSVGEVMAIGRSFPEALQKAVRMANIGATGLGDYPYPIADIQGEISQATDRRLFALYRYFRSEGITETAQSLSHIDPWFLNQIQSIAKAEQTLIDNPLTPERLKHAKRLGFGDAALAKLLHMTEEAIREKRIQNGIVPHFKQIDTLAGEFAAQTNYLYATYHGGSHDLSPPEDSAVIVLGSGPYSIGSSVEFDWCAVNALRSLRKHGETTVMINSNPETVSTDFDESDRLYFEELTAERVRDIIDFETPKGVVVSVGGQIANNLALPLSKAGCPLWGTSAESIDQAEDRKKFSSLLNQLAVDQPAWEEVISTDQARAFAQRVGYPILARPSYVLSGAAMNVICNDTELEEYIKEAILVSRGHPVVISQFIDEARELEVDGVASAGTVVVQAVTEHIENAGVHSGDATVVFPPQRLYLSTIRQAKQLTSKIVKALKITGPFNIQFIAKENALKVIECNVRASRSFPFVSKVARINLSNIIVETLLGHKPERSYETLELDWVGVKTSQFSYHRLKGADPVAQVEMASTGEVACLGDNFHEAVLRSWLATGISLRNKRLLVSIGGDKKDKLLPSLQKLEAQGWQLFATEGTHAFLAKHGVASRFLYKVSEARPPNVTDAISDRSIALIISTPNARKPDTRSDGYLIRRLAVDHNIPLITNLQFAQVFLQCITDLDPNEMSVKAWQEYAYAD